MYILIPKQHLEDVLKDNDRYGILQVPLYATIERATEQAQLRKDKRMLVIPVADYFQVYEPDGTTYEDEIIYGLSLKQEFKHE